MVDDDDDDDGGGYFGSVKGGLCWLHVVTPW